MAELDTTHQDAVMSWLQNRELKDHKLGAARSGRARTVDITTAIGRLQDLGWTLPSAMAAAIGTASVLAVALLAMTRD